MERKRRREITRAKILGREKPAEEFQSGDEVKVEASGHQPVSNDRVRLIVQEYLAIYEKDVVMPRHKETQTTLEGQNRILAKIDGSVLTGKWLLGFLVTLAALILGWKR